MARHSSQRSSRRRFFRGAAAGLSAAALSGITEPRAIAQQGGRVRGFDHVALPMQNTDAMLAFYRALGFDVKEGPAACSVYVGEQMINFHRPETWQRASFTLRAPAAKPPCGDLCFVWEGKTGELTSLLTRAGAKIVEGPVGRPGGRRETGTSFYVRDPDGNLIEFMIYS